MSTQTLIVWITLVVQGAAAIAIVAAVGYWLVHMRRTARYHAGAARVAADRLQRLRREIDCPSPAPVCRDPACPNAGVEHGSTRARPPQSFLRPASRP